MLILTIVTVAFLASITGILQWKYAQTGYPPTWQWKMLLFFCGFAVCAIGALLLPFSSLTPLEELLLVLGGGLFGGYGSLVLLPQKMRTIIPKKE